MRKTRPRLVASRTMRSHRPRRFRGRGWPSVLRTVGIAAVFAAFAFATTAGLDIGPPSSNFSPTAYVGPPPRNCAEARARGIAPMTRWHPAYSAHLDRDRDGIACEPYFGR